MQEVIAHAARGGASSWSGSKQAQLGWGEVSLFLTGLQVGRAWKGVGGRPGVVWLGQRQRRGDRWARQEVTGTG